MSLEKIFTDSGSLIFLPNETIRFENKAKLEGSNYSASGTLYLTDQRLAYYGKKSLFRGTGSMDAEDGFRLLKGKLGIGTVIRATATAVKAASNVGSRLSGSDIIGFALELQKVNFAEMIGKIRKNLLVSVIGVPKPLKFDMSKKDIEQFLFQFKSTKGSLPASTAISDFIQTQQIYSPETLTEEELTEVKQEWEEVKLRYEIGEYTSDEYKEIRKDFLPYLKLIETREEQAITKQNQDQNQKQNQHEEQFDGELYQKMQEGLISKTEYAREYNKIYGTGNLTEEEIEELVLRLDIGEISKKEFYKKLRV